MMLGDTQNQAGPYGGTGEWSQITQSGAGKFPNPFWDIASEYVPRNLQQVFEWCFPAGTQITLDEAGHTKAIEDIVPGDMVLTKNCTLKAVKAIGQRRVTEPITVIKAAGLTGIPLRLTNQHKVYCWRPTSTLKPSRLNFDKATLTKVPAGDLRKGDWLVTPLPAYAVSCMDWPYSLFICGMYVSEGCLVKRVISDGSYGGVYPRDVQFTLGSHETQLIARLVKELQEYCGHPAHVYNNPKRPDVTVIRICDPALAIWLQEHFGELAHNKQLPTALFHLPIDLQLEFLGALIDGDGYVSRRDSAGVPTTLSLCTVSKQLVTQLSMLASHLNMRTGVSCVANKDSTYKAGSMYYQMTWCVEGFSALVKHMTKLGGLELKGNPGHGDVTISNGFVWRKIRDISTEQFDGLVYNFEVDDIEHNYIANNILVSNCEYIYMTYGTYRSASRKVVRYFLTEIVLDGANADELEKYEELVNKKLHLLTQLSEIGDDWMTYGNSFVSVYFPFDRFLICPKCHTHFHIDTIAYKFKFKELTFSAKCPKCEYDGDFDREDMRSPDTGRVKLIRWNPKRMRLRYHDISGEIEYYYELEPRFMDKLRNGNRFYLNKTPWSIIECAARTPLSDQPLYKFERDQIYHMHESTLAGLPIRGWGIPPILPNFKLAYYIQVLRRYDEAIALDYIIPFRILFPQQSQAAGQDPLQMLSMDVFISHMKDMVAAKRANATDIQITPFPIGYEMLGGEGRTLSPKDNIAQAMDELLNAIGYPAELYRGSLAIQAFPVALRLFEKTWGTLVDGYNDLTDWVLKKLARYYGWAPISGALRSVTLADDIERKALQLQAAAGMDISKQTAFRPLGIDFMEEQKKVVEEQKEIMKLQQEAMEEQEVSQIGTGDPSQQGGMAGGPGGTPGATPGDVNQQAKDIAYQLVTQTPEQSRRGELMKIKQSNPTLHALVIQEMEALRGQLANQGQQMMLQQMKTGAAHDEAMDRMPSPMMLGLLIANQVLDYSPADMRKLAMAVKRAVPDLKAAYSLPELHPTIKAFKFVYGKRMGWI